MLYTARGLIIIIIKEFIKQQRCFQTFISQRTAKVSFVNAKATRWLEFQTTRMLHQTKSEAPARLPEAAAIQIRTSSFHSPIPNVTYVKHRDTRTEHIACLMLISTCLSRRIYNTWPTSTTNQTRRSS